MLYNKNQHTNLWIMLGDNAYSTGTDAQYQSSVFDMYPTFLRTSVLWPAIGNHDSINANSLTQTGIYYDIFSLPKTAATGGISTGVDSSTEAYYSFDYANVHFIVLDSHELNTTFRLGMTEWLNNDLAVANADWNIAIWHHPPYSKGSHDSDGDPRMTYVRENYLEILENVGVDLVLTGHSHSYERSWLIDGHYGFSNTFSEIDHIVDGSEGTPPFSAYEKPLLGQSSHDGTIYVVSGSSGRIGSINGVPHAAMRNKLPLVELGSLIVDVNNRVMDVTFLNSSNEIKDVFRIVKNNIIFVNGFESHKAYE
jgi:hypothetical protein